MSSEQPHWVLSGGLATGKSVVRSLLADAGMATIDADRVGHLVLEPQGPAFSEVVARWPGVVENGEISREALAEVVFNDPRELAALESITHPHIFGAIRTRVEKIESAVVVEIPLLSHGLGDQWLRLVVDSREDVRLERAMARGMTEQDARARIAAQASRSEWLAAADLVIPNHGSRAELETTVGALVDSLGG